MVVVKEKQFLVFYLDMEKSNEELSGRTVKYDLSTGETIGIKGGKVKGLQSQLGNFKIREIINCIQDEKYKLFLDKVYYYTDNNYWNFGTLLEKAKKYKWMESLCVVGITDFDVNLRTELKDIPKWLIKYCKGEFDGENHLLSFHLLRYYNMNPDLFQASFNFIKENDFEFEWNSFIKEFGRFVLLINDYNYNYKSLLEYINNIMRYEGEDTFYYVLRLIEDEAKMRKTMATKVVNDKIIVCKYDKYWKNLRTTHNITIRNYNRIKQTYDEIMFKNRYRQELEYKDKEYCIIHPKETQDMKDEASMQSNCVASYISKVIDGNCSVVFMRKVDSPNKSLVTVEIKNNKIVQRLGRYNQEPTQEELEFLKKYDEKVLTPLRK